VRPRSEDRGQQEEDNDDEPDLGGQRGAVSKKVMGLSASSAQARIGENGENIGHRVE